MSHSDIVPGKDTVAPLEGTAAVGWLKAGWKDLWTNPLPSLVYGVIVFAVSWALILGLILLDLSAYLFPALAGFLVIGPILAIGLYEKSRRIENQEPVTLSSMLFFHARSTTQILLAGVLLCLLVMLWIRAAVILYALFFGLRPFDGLDQILPFIFGTPEGWALFIVGSAVGGLFAAFAFSISVFGIPMLYDRKTDAFTAMAVSMNTVWHQLRILLPWGAIVVALGVLTLLSGLVLIIIVFPLLGHATWHAYRETCDTSRLD
ncbi:MAG: DUF2189 domain-containing protein [Alphaproteobacteria bacterium]|nr:DUF2189 domain-containing protein [Alphaproteobacteria bacterium]